FNGLTSGRPDSVASVFTCQNHPGRRRLRGDNRAVWTAIRAGLARRNSWSRRLSRCSIARWRTGRGGICPAGHKPKDEHQNDYAREWEQPTGFYALSMHRHNVQLSLICSLYKNVRRQAKDGRIEKTVSPGQKFRAHPSIFPHESTPNKETF